MTLSFTQLQSRFACWREWEPNPILVKELRQAVRSRILESMLMFLLLMLFVGSVMALVGENLRDGVMETGRGMFCACLTMLAVGGLIFLPLYTGIRLALEKHQSDLMFFTPQRVQKLVQGKALTGVCLAGLFLSVCLPFMAFSNLLRGLDLITILFTVSLLFAAIVVAILVSVTLGAARLPVIGKVILGMLFTVGLILFCLVFLFFLFSIVQTGAQPLLADANFQFEMYFFLIAMVVSSLVAYGLSLSFIAKDLRRPKLEDNLLRLIPSHD
jgi:hypothetical protein